MMWKTIFVACCLFSSLSWHPPSFALSMVMSPYIEDLNHRNQRDCEAAGGSFTKWYNEIYCRRENPILRQTISQEEFANLSSEQIDNKLAALGLPPIGGMGHYPGHPFYKLTRAQANALTPQQTQLLYELPQEQLKAMSAAETLHHVLPTRDPGP